MTKVYQHSVIIGSIVIFIDLQEFENDEICFSAIAHLQKASIAACSVNVPDSKSSAYKRNYHNLFKQNVSSAHNEKIHINESNFW